MVLTVTCSGCGSPVPAGDRFCGTCGNPITGSAILSGEGAAAFDPWVELLQKLRQATIELMGMTCVLYMLMSYPVAALSRRLEKRLGVGVGVL